MATYKPVLHKYKRKDGLQLVQIRITKYKKSAKLGTSYYVRNKDWNTKGLVRSTDSLFEKYNRALAAIIKELQEIEIDADQEGKMFNAFEIKKAYEDRRLRQVLFLYQDWIDQSSGKDITKGSYEQSRANFESFLGNNKDLLVQNVTIDTVKDYQRFILNQGSNQGTANLYLSRLSSVMKRAVTKGIIPQSKNPFSDHKYGNHETEFIFLSLSEIITLSVADIKKKAALYRDIYICQFLAGGMRIRDAFLLERACIKGDWERLEYKMSKNGKIKSIPISLWLKKILQRWVSEDRDLVFPAIDPKGNVDKETRSKASSMNISLKNIAKQIGINPDITTHSARHSFGKLAESNTKDLKGLQSVFAHSKLETTMDYIEDKLDLDKYDYIVASVQNDFEKLNNS